jgi:hypothetical protein
VTEIIEDKNDKATVFVFPEDGKTISLRIYDSNANECMAASSIVSITLGPGEAGTLASLLMLSIEHGNSAAYSSLNYIKITERI